MKFNYEKWNLHVTAGCMMLTGLSISCCFSVMFKGKDKSNYTILILIHKKNEQKKCT